MKKILLISGLIVATGSALQAQTANGSDAGTSSGYGNTQQYQPMVSHAPGVIQVTDYAQGNTNYTNNSMFNNAPENPNAGRYTGNATYTDPTRFENRLPSSTTPTSNNLYGTLRETTEPFPVNSLIYFETKH